MIGFRVPSEMISQSFLHEYFKLFDFIEIKVKNKYEFLPLQKKLNSECLGKYSIHLPKRMLYNEEELGEAKMILKLISNCEVFPVNLVTHFCGYDEEAISILKKLRKALPEEVSICIENIQTYNMQYIDELEFAIKSLEKKNISICFDLGHFMYGGEKLGFSQREMLEILKSKQAICHSIKEIHIHDFNCETDHISLSRGQLDQKLLGEILQFLPTVPIIIETNVKDAEEDGIIQVNWLKEIVNYGNMSN